MIYCFENLKESYFIIANQKIGINLMSIRSIQIENLLSFDRFTLNEIKDINCIVGKNNAGKSNLLKLINYFYVLLDGRRELPPHLHCKYSKFGRISITYDVERIRNIVTSRKNSDIPFFKYIFNALFKNSAYSKNTASFQLSLTINENNSVEWSTEDKDVLYIILYLYPFFEIQTRHIDLHDWAKLWDLVCRLKSFNVNKIDSNEIIEFFDEKLSSGGNEYRDYVEKIQVITQTKEYSYIDKVLTFVKAGLDGHNFVIDGESLKLQSDGTNSSRYIEIFLTLLITLTRRDYISPTIYVDEPEVGLHPKLIEQLVKKIFITHNSFMKIDDNYEKKKYATPYPKIFFSTHSPNVIKTVIKLFPTNHTVYHFSKPEKSTCVKKMNSQYKDPRFLNIFSDNEARLFFSDFILFVEGETELELFGNLKLISKFKQLEKVDVYKINMVSIGGISPRFSNAAIPFLVLYDLDKVMEVDIPGQQLKLNTTNVDFLSFLKKSNRSYYGSDEFEKKRFLQKYLSNENGGRVTFDQTNVSITRMEKFDGMGFGEYIDLINSSILSYYNYTLAKTTIEGALINKDTKKYFLRWIFYEFTKFSNVGVLKNKSATLAYFANNTNFSSDRDVMTAIKALLEPTTPSDLTPFEALFIQKLKKAYIKILLKKINKGFSNDVEIMTAFRLLFNGKTESLVAFKNKSKLEQQYRIALEDLEKFFCPLNHLTTKTSGWVTKFLDFSIDMMDKKTEQKGFYGAFSKDFSEIFDILEKLQPG